MLITSQDTAFYAVVGMSEKGTRCGVWVEQGGMPVPEVSGYEVIEKSRE